MLQPCLRFGLVDGIGWPKVVLRTDGSLTFEAILYLDHFDTDKEVIYSWASELGPNIISVTAFILEHFYIFFC